MPAPPPLRLATTPMPQRQVAAPAMPPRCLFPLPTPAASSSTPEPRRSNLDFIPGFHPAAVRSPTPAPPALGGYGNDAGGPVRGYTMAARRGAAPFFNCDGGGKSEAGPHPHVGECAPRRSGPAPPERHPPGAGVLLHLGGGFAGVGWLDVVAERRLGSGSGEDGCRSTGH